MSYIEIYNQINNFLDKKKNYILNKNKEKCILISKLIKN